ncbi:MAG TPA: hypothetical protein DCL54_08660 [Alphaproteobacteria bacterium]|nr:hypothetical protein [Alphaproteobacteria bacterium]HAJ46637.1 hypothetical protein [Alphaproteobacteria bacterium]
MTAKKRLAFVNCPFDSSFKRCFEAIIFTCYACGVEPVTALSNDGMQPLRFDALCELIRRADFGIHDLSRTESDGPGRPRFNMPFELGLFMGAKVYGSGANRLKRAVVLVREKYVLGAYLSDMAGIDPVAHGDNPRDVIRLVRDALNTWMLAGRKGKGPKGKAVPGPEYIAKKFDEFQTMLPNLAESKGFLGSDLNVLDAHVDYCVAVDEFVSIMDLSY